MGRKKGEAQAKSAQAQAHTPAPPLRKKARRRRIRPRLRPKHRSRRRKRPHRPGAPPGALAQRQGTNILPTLGPRRHTWPRPKHRGRRRKRPHRAGPPSAFAQKQGACVRPTLGPRWQAPVLFLRGHAVCDFVIPRKLELVAHICRISAGRAQGARIGLLGAFSEYDWVGTFSTRRLLSHQQ